MLWLYFEKFSYAAFYTTNSLVFVSSPLLGLDNMQYDEYIHLYTTCTVLYCTVLYCTVLVDPTNALYRRLTTNRKLRKDPRQGREWKSGTIWPFHFRRECATDRSGEWTFSMCAFGRSSENDQIYCKLWKNINCLQITDPREREARANWGGFKTFTGLFKGVTFYSTVTH